MEANTDVDAIGKSTNDVERVSPAGHGTGDDGAALFDDGLAVKHGDNSVPETPAARNAGSTCGIAKWSKRAKTSSWNDATHNLRTRVNRRPIPGKVHKKRQTLQDMARPLKRWLCRNRNNPYPTKTEKIMLASDASMTITQVSNWFANARRRLKTTVTQPQMSWASRISLYNSFVVGNQELLSLSSDDTLWDADPDSNDAAISTDEDYTGSNTAAVYAATTTTTTTAAPTATNDADWTVKNDGVSFGNWREHRVTSDPLAQYAPSLEECGETSAEHVTYTDDIIAHKYKQTILQRYLNDARQYALSLPDDPGQNRHRNLSGSLSSHDYEDLSTSARSTPTREHTTEDGMDDYYNDASKEWPKMQTSAEEDIYWKEISAALALTNLARPRTYEATSAAGHV